MATLAQIFGTMTEQDVVKEAQVEELDEGVQYDEDTLEKAAEYDEIGRRLAHQMWDQVQGDPDLFKEAMGDQLPPALAAVAAKASGKAEEKEEEKSEKKDEGDEDDEEDKKKLEKLQEKKAAVLQAMQDDDEYLGYILDKYTEPVE
ncbi:MAG: hypothetical protein DRP42_00645 [Tenericutes bacterium]|nr:MAG: hypothetical protein DRP42_00645 [Mycoplasmatota bacterium]